jgi:hypothetical protein
MRWAKTGVINRLNVGYGDFFPGRGLVRLLSAGSPKLRWLAVGGRTMPNTTTIFLLGMTIAIGAPMLALAAMAIGGG